MTDILTNLHLISWGISVDMSRLDDSEVTRLKQENGRPTYAEITKKGTMMGQIFSAAEGSNNEDIYDFMTP